MGLSNKTKSELLSEIKRLNKKLAVLEGSVKGPGLPDEPKALAQFFNSDPFFRNAYNTMLIIDRSGVILNINKVRKHRKKSDIIGRNVNTFITAESLLSFRRAVSLVFRKGEHQSLQLSWYDATGAEHHYRNKISPLFSGKKIIAALIDLIDVTDEVQANKRFRETAERFEALARNVDDVLFRFAVYPEYKQEYISPAIERITGYSAEEFYRDPGLSVRLIHPDDREVVHGSNVKRGNGRPFEVRWITKDGRTIWTETVNRPVKDSRGRIIAYEGISRDISERKRTGDALVESEQNLELVLENINDLVYYIEFLPKKQKRVKYLGPQIESILGVSASEYERDAQKLISLCHPDDIRSIKAAAARLKKTKTPQKFTYRFYHRKKKEYVSVEELVTPQINEKGKYVGNFGLVRDVTEQRLREEELQEEKNRASTYLDVAGVVIVVIDKSEKVTLINKLGCTLLGYPESKILGRNWIDSFVPAEVRKDMKVLFRKFFRAEPLEDKFRESEVITKSGERRVISWNSSEVRDKEGRIVAILSSGQDITEKKKAEQALKESEMRFRMLAENASDVVYRFVFHPKQRYEYVSPSIFAMSGYTPEDFYADPFLGFRVIHPDDLHLLGNSEELLRQRKAGNIKAPALVTRWIKKDGTVVWIETRNKPILENGVLVALEGISRDITIQKQKEIELKESEERFRLISNATFEGIVFSEKGRIIDANDQFVHMFRFSSVKDFLGLDLVSDFVVPAQRAEARKYLRLPRSEPFEVQARTKSGELITVEAKGQNIPYFGRNIRATVIYNITERKHYEFSLRESERTLSTLMGNLPGMAYRCDYDEYWTMRFVSSGFKELTGYNPRDILNNYKRSFADLMHPEDKGTIRPVIEKAISQKKPFEIEYRIICADGTQKWVWEKGEGVFGEDGQLLFLEGFITDVNEKKENELALERSRKNYKSLIDHAPDGILIYKENKLEFANPSALRLLEADTFDEIYLKPSFFFLFPEYQANAQKRVLQALKGEVLPFVEIRMQTLKGNVRELEAKPIAIQYDGTEAVQIVLHDIAPQKQLIRQQLRAQLAEETNEKLQQEITERKNAERILQETQKYTRLLIESSLDMICASDKEGRIMEFNAAACATFGYEVHEVLGKPVSMLYADPKQRELITVQELFAKGRYSGEVTNLKKNGETFTAYLSASVLKDDAGNIVGAMGVSRDISDLKRAEQELKLSEEKYRAIYDQAYVGIARVGLHEGDFIEVNQRLCDMLGYSSEELCTMTAWQISHPDDLQTSLPERREFLESGRDMLSTEKKYLHKNGSVVYANLTMTLVRDSAGTPKYFVSVYEDITERKKAEEQLYAQSAKLNAVFESSSHLIWTVDRNCRVTSFNRNFARFFRLHYNVEVAEGQSMIAGEMVPGPEYNNYWQKKYEVVLLGERQHFESKLLSRTGKVVWREVFLNPIFDENGLVTEISGIGHDITEKKLAEEKIRQSLQEKEVLLKEVHHRVKNNLQVISSILNLQSSYVKDVSTLNILKESQNRIKSMAFIHESLYQTKDFSSINFSEYVVNLAQNLIHSYSHVGHEIKLNLDIQNVFLNLDLAIPCGLIINEIVSNALKYAFVDNRDDSEISIRMELDGENLILDIGDNGIGLPPEIDYRHTESLGLQLVVTLTDQLNGNIELNTENGTKYRIVFKQNQVKNRF
jgi:PAS domain S-box-containing protein